jgi:ribosomal protein S18 acetylase RimI-like enzyme
MAAVVRRIRRDEALTLKRVRLAALADAPSAFGSTYAEEAERPDAFWEERARRGAEGEDRVTYLAVLNDDVVGLVGGLSSQEMRVVELVSVWVLPTARRSGLARSLALAVVEWARSGSANAVHLWVTVGNAPARGLYESLGFCDTDDFRPLPSDPCSDERRMTLAL